MFKTAIPVLASLDAEETIEFYTTKLGFILIANWDGYVIMHRDGVYLHFWACADPEIPKMTSCYVFVTEVEQLYEEYKATGVIHPNDPLQDRPWGTREFSILDVHGNLIRIGQSLPKD